MRDLLYRMREGIYSLFRYPVHTLKVGTIDYDVYWKDKRGTEHIGELSSWQEARASYIGACILKDEGESISVADIGCGDGSILHYLGTHDARISRLIGYDTSRFALEHAANFGVAGSVFDARDTGSYQALVDADYYLLLEVLEHVPESEELLRAALAHAKRGVFFSIPNTGYMHHRLRLLLGRFPLQWRLTPNEHLRFWTYRDLVWWLRALGITNYTIHAYKGIPILNRILPSLFGAGLVLYINNIKTK